MFRELRKWAPNRADPRRGARISERVAQHRTWGSREESLSSGVFDTRSLHLCSIHLVTATRGVRYTFVTPLLDTPRYRHAFVCLAWGYDTSHRGKSGPRPPPALVASLVVVRPRECSRRSCPTPAPRPSAPPRAPRRPARARGMTRGPRPRSGGLGVGASGGRSGAAMEDAPLAVSCRFPRAPTATVVYRRPCAGGLTRGVFLLTTRLNVIRTYGRVPFVFLHRCTASVMSS